VARWSAVLEPSLPLTLSLLPRPGLPPSRAEGAVDVPEEPNFVFFFFFFFFFEGAFRSSSDAGRPGTTAGSAPPGTKLESCVSCGNEDGDDATGP